MRRNGTEVLGKVFLAILVLFASFLKAQHSSTCEFLLLDGGVVDGVVVGGNGQARHERFQFDIAPREKAEIGRAHV